MAFSQSDKLALTVTILKPEKLNFKILLEMVLLFRRETKRWPDMIEFTPQFITTFYDKQLADWDPKTQQDTAFFLGIPIVSNEEFHSQPVISHAAGEPIG